VVWWRKRIWRCVEASCPVSTWTETHDYAGKRSKLTKQAIGWATDALRHDDTTVSAVARHLGVDWHTAWAAIKTEARRRVKRPDRLKGVKTLGVDEHIWRPGLRAANRASPSWST
jgi:transposase